MTERQWLACADAEPLCDPARVVNILASAAGSGPTHRLAMIVKLQRDADDFGTGLSGERGSHRAVDAAGHGNDDPSLPGRPIKVKADGH